MSRARNVRQTVLRLDSRFRTLGTNNEPTFHLEQRLVNVSMVELRKVIIPNTEYPVNLTNNHVRWTDSAGVDQSFFITPGSYTAQEYIDQFVNGLDVTETGGALYTGIVSNGKFTIVSSLVSPWALLGDDPTHVPSDMHFPMSGFTIGTSTGPGNATLNATNVFDVSGPNYLLLRSPNLVNGSTDFSHFSGPANVSHNTTNVLEAVYKSSNFGTSILTDYNTKLRQPFHGVLSVVELQLSYATGQVVDLNGRPWLVEMRVRHSR